MKPYFFTPSLLWVGILGLLALACSSSNPDPTTGGTSTLTKGRVLATSETGTSIYVLDLEQGIVETQAKSVSSAAKMIISPEGKYSFMAQASGNRVDIFKMGTSTTASATSETSAAVDEHGHNHKPRFSGDHDHGTTVTTSSGASSTTSSTSTSSVDLVDMSITGTGLGQVVARGKWVAVQFAEEVVVVAEDDFENIKSNSISETIDVVHKISTPNQIKGMPGVPMDEEHIAIGNWVFEIEDNTSGANLSYGKNSSANALLSSNILTATRSGEGTALFGTDQGLLVVGKHSESGNVEWEDLMVSYPTVPESQIFLSEGHDHEEGEEEVVEEHGDEHEEVMEHRSATQWATMDGLGHAFVHLTHESHSAGIYLVEAEGLEEDSDLTKVFEYIDGTSSTSERPVGMTIVTLHEEVESADKKYLLILMSSGNLRIHDAANEGAFVKSIESLITPVTDFHVGENNLPGMTAGLGKVFVGDPSTNSIHQIGLKSFQVELSWKLSIKPNRLLLMGESTLSEGSNAAHDHD